MSATPETRHCWVIAYTGDSPILAIKSIRPFVYQDSLAEAKRVFDRVVSGSAVNLGLIEPLDATAMAATDLVLEWR